MIRESLCRRMTWARSRSCFNTVPLRPESGAAASTQKSIVTSKVVRVFHRVSLQRVSHCGQFPPARDSGKPQSPGRSISNRISSRIMGMTLAGSVHARSECIGSRLPHRLRYVQRVFANTPSPPYYAVIFTSVQDSGNLQAYERMSRAMADLAAKQPGFLGIETVATRRAAASRFLFGKTLSRSSPGRNTRTTSSRRGWSEAEFYSKFRSAHLAGRTRLRKLEQVSFEEDFWSWSESPSRRADRYRALVHPREAVRLAPAYAGRLRPLSIRAPVQGALLIRRVEIPRPW